MIVALAARGQLFCLGGAETSREHAMRALHRWVRSGFCVLFFLVSPSAVSHAQTRISINDTGADDDEQRLEQALTQRGSVEFVQTRLQDVAETLSRDFQVPIVLARKKLEEASFSPDAT